MALSFFVILQSTGKKFLLREGISNVMIKMSKTNGIMFVDECFVDIEVCKNRFSENETDSKESVTLTISIPFCPYENLYRA